MSALRHFKLREILFVSALFYSIFLLKPYFVNAALSCTASVTPADSQPNQTEKPFTFTVTNPTETDNIQWFKITKPLAGMTFGPVTLSGWDKTASGDSYIFQASPDPIGPGQSKNPVIGMNIGDIGGQSGDWVVQASDWWDGTSPITCTGILGLSVSAGAADTTAPVISNVAVSSITTSSAIISWITDEAASSLVYYGIEYAGPYSKSVAALTVVSALTVL